MQCDDDTLMVIQNKSLELLISFDNLCRENNIQYFIMYGTLIGAIRHEGFIPWDDDIDIGLTRDNYEKLIHIDEKILPKNIVITHPDNEEPFLDFISRYCDTRIRYHDYEQNRDVSLGIDLFVLDNAIDDDFHFRIHTWILFFIYALARGHRAKSKKINSKNGKILDIVVKPIQLVGRKKKIADICEKYRLISMKGNSNNTVYFSNTTPDSVRIRYLKSDFEKLVNVSFMGHEFPAPAGYDRILRETYGNYMELPPIDEQKPRHEFNELIIEE